MAIADKLVYLQETKEQIKNAIIEKGVSIADTDTFRSYAEKISGIETGESTGQDEFYNLRTNNGTRGDGLFAYLPAESQKNTEMISFIKNLNVSNMTSFSSMFINCSNLTNLDLSAWDTNEVTTIYQMFSSCFNLIQLNLSSWDTSKLKTLSYAFNGCNKLELVDLTDWNTSNATSFTYMFPCSKLVEIVGTLDLQNATNITNMFGSSGCPLLEKVYLKNLNLTGLNLIKCVKLSHESLIYLINNAATTETAKTINLGETNLNKLTDEEKAIAIGKGWTLA